MGRGLGGFIQRSAAAPSPVRTSRNPHWYRMPAQIHHLGMGMGIYMT